MGKRIHDIDDFGLGNLLCCGAGKRIHNIDNFGLGNLLCCGTGKRIHNIDKNFWLLCVCCAVASEQRIYIWCLIVECGGKLKLFIK